MKIIRFPSGIWRIFIVITLAAFQFATFGRPFPARATNFYARDEFQTAAYNNQNGTVNWATNWVETDDGANVATGGEIQITGGELRITNSADGTRETIYRSVDLSAAASATLSLQFRHVALEGGENVVIDISTNGGGSYTTLETITGATANNNVIQRRVYDISSYMVANTRIRIRTSAGTYNADDYYYFDNVEVSYFTASTHDASTWLYTGQTYYVPIPEDQALTALRAIGAAPACSSNPVNNPTYVYVSITVVANNTLIIYDHWEDSFEADITSPVQSTTEIWGDGDLNNGRPPGAAFATDLLSAGSIIILRNPVNTTTLGLIDFDGGDKVTASEAIAMTRSTWATGSETLLGGSVEMLDTSVWGTSYVVPVDNTVTANQMFEYTGLAVMAAGDGTQVYRNGTYVATLNQGQSYLFDNTVSRGDVITASGNIQAQLLTGDICTTYEASYYTLYPTDLLSSSYYAPVATNAPDTTAVFLNNPGSGNITVQWETGAGAQTPVVVPAGGTVSVQLPDNAAARFYTTDGSIFQAISAVDVDATSSGGNAYDWGYTLIPENQLTQQAQVGWGPGQDPTRPTTENGSPVWVMAAEASGNSYVCVDYNGDRTGASTDSYGQQYDTRLTLPPLQRSIVYDPDGDQTGMRLYLCDGSELTDARIAVAWGQDPDTASASAPGLDVGTSVPPLPKFTAAKGAQLTGDIDGDGLYDVGEIFTYRIRITNTGALPVPAGSITVEDIIPQYTLYVPNSTDLDGTPIPDDSDPATAFPLDEGGYTINQDLPILGQFIVSFDVVINANLPGGSTIQNNARVSGIDLVYSPQVDVPVQPPASATRLGDRVWADLDGDGVQDAGEPGLSGVTVELSDGTCVLGSTCPTAVTDANGEYAFYNLPDGSYTVVVHTDTLPAGYTQTGDPDQPGVPCTACDSQHSLALSAGNRPFLTADFGYNGPTLAVNKTSSILGNVYPGDTIQYTIVVQNLTGGTHNNVVVSDPLPAGLTYVPGSAQVTAPVSTLPTVGDAFNTLASFTDGQDSNGAADPSWLPGGWIEVNEGDGAGAGDIQVLAEGGNNRLRLQDNDNTGEGARRDADISTCSAATLTLSYRRDGLDDAGDYARLSIGKDGALTDNLFDFAGPATDAAYQNYSRDITPWISSQTRIQLLTSPTMGDTDIVYFDDVQIVCTLRTPTSYAAGAPPDLVVAGDGYSLWAGEQMTVVFQATVDDPVTAGLSGFNNTVSVTSNLQTTALQDSASNDLPPAAVGSRVWLDENSDGYQDPGEPGLANITVELYAADGTTLLATTQTDTYGEYLFTNLPPGNFYIRVNNASLPPGVTQTSLYPNPGADFTNQDQTTGYLVTLEVGSPERVADFGYNYNTSDQVNNNTGTGALGDRIWIDADGDGVQDPNEAGLGGVILTLYADSNNDGFIDPLVDAPIASTVSRLDGSFIFDDLAPGAYMITAGTPVGYVQTGDPDHFGGTGLNDGLTTSPLIVGPGDVYVNVDFGYQPTAATGTIGNTIWLNHDGDNTLDPGEPGLRGVEVALIVDVNGDGVWDPDGLDNLPGTADDESIIAVDITDANGSYSFSGLPLDDGDGDADYLVWVPDTNNQLRDLEQNYDSNGGNDGLSAIALSNSSPANSEQNFGYAPPNHQAGEGMIGSQVFFDRNANGVFDPGEGLAQVTVRLYDNNGALVATDVTNQNGEYFFGNLDSTQTYQVRVDTTTLPGGAAAWSNTIDPDGGAANQSTVNLGAPGGDGNADPDGLDNGLNLGQNFAYQAAAPLGTVGSLVWDDRDGDGLYEPNGNDGNPATTFDNEIGIGGVTLELYHDADGDGRLDAGEALMATTTTAADGSYSFTNLPVNDGSGTMNYLLHISDEAQILRGRWHSLGAPNVDNNSQLDAFAFSLSPASPVANQADFGYFIDGAAVGNRVWRDVDADGVQDSVETGLPGVELVLTITFPDGSTEVLRTTSDSNGFYSFGNLLLDEDFNTTGGGLVYTISTVVSPYIPSPVGTSGNPWTDSNDRSGTAATVQRGEILMVLQDPPTNEPLGASFDFGFRENPTAIDLASFSAEYASRRVVVSWQTLLELDAIGFNLYRSTSPDGEWLQLNDELILSQVPGGFGGAFYEFVDTEVQPGVTYYYWLVFIDTSGETTYGPVAVMAEHILFLPFVRR
jgi:uncharacterized repeat protein (TIGR01451 family)